MDADWAGNPFDRRRSTIGFYLFLGDALISWKVSKWKIISRSSTEAEYRVLAAIVTDIIWVQCLLQDFKILLPSPTTLYCDNLLAITLTNNPILHASIKHVEIDFYFVWDCINKNILSLYHITF